LVAVTAVLTALVLLYLVRGLIWLWRVVRRQVDRILPQRISMALAAVLIGGLLISLANNLLVQTTLDVLDQTFANIDRVVDDGVDPTKLPAVADAKNSLINWNDIGRNGKKFLTDGPMKEEIARVTGQPAQDPIRVYAGFSTGTDFTERAHIAVEELKRIGGFDRSVLVVAVPTGTGWLDPAAVQPLAHLHRGDLSIVSLQYSYLPSWLTLIVDPDRSRRAAKALFGTVFAHWRRLPEESRPRLYLFGLSLGALGSEASANLVSLLEDPIQGALWAGPPFASSLWPLVTAGRNPGTPQWRPVFGDSQLIRFLTADGFAPLPPSADRPRWGPIRIVYLQHPSDPMSFFSTRLAFTKPDWLGENRGPDISPFFVWVPVVTFFQVGFDVPMATTVPGGHGHTFRAAGYIDGWVAVTDPANWTDADTEKLKEHFADFNASPL
jgi:uncharacterized membrane protein